MSRFPRYAIARLALCTLFAALIAVISGLYTSLASSSSTSSQRLSPTPKTTFPRRQSNSEYDVYRSSLRAVNARPMTSAAEMLHGVGCFEFKQPGGQVQLETPYGKTLQELASSADVLVAIETGTWDGSGSSEALGMGLKSSDGILFTIEAVEEKWIHAEHNLAQYPVKCLLGVGVDSSELPTELDVENEGGVLDTPKEEWSKWLQGERAVSEAYPIGFIKPLCERYEVDLIHIDGGEFSGNAELRAALRYCKNLRYIVMDDTLTYKNKANYRILSHAEEWEIYREDKEDRHGWAVFQRRFR